MEAEMITEVEEEDDHLNLKSQRFFIVEAGQERVLTLMEALWWDRLGGGCPFICVNFTSCNAVYEATISVLLIDCLILSPVTSQPSAWQQYAHNQRSRQHHASAINNEGFLILFTNLMYSTSFSKLNISSLPSSVTDDFSIC